MRRPLRSGALPLLMPPVWISVALVGRCPGLCHLAVVLVGTGGAAFTGSGELQSLAVPSRSLCRLSWRLGCSAGPRGSVCPPSGVGCAAGHQILGLRDLVAVAWSRAVPGPGRQVALPLPWGPWRWPVSLGRAPRPLRVVAARSLVALTRGVVSRWRAAVRSWDSALSPRLLGAAPSAPLWLPGAVVCASLGASLSRLFSPRTLWAPAVGADDPRAGGWLARTVCARSRTGWPLRMPYVEGSGTRETCDLCISPGTQHTPLCRTVRCSGQHPTIGSQTCND